MDKQSFLEELTRKVQNGEVTEQEVMHQMMSATNQTSSDLEETSRTKLFSITNTLYFLGAAIVIIGLIIFVAQIWEDLGSPGRIGVTLGLGLLLAVIGTFLLQRKEEAMGMVFHFLGGMLIPSGALVTLYELFDEPTTLWPVVITMTLTTLFYGALMLTQKHVLLTFFFLANATSLLYVWVAAMLSDDWYYQYEQLYSYLTIAVGVSYLGLAHTFINTWNKKLVGVLHFFGITAILGGGFSLVFTSGFWELFYFVVIGTGIFLSIYLRSRIILIMSTLFLLAHVSYITGEYFADSIGWPISLVLLGFLFIGLGYISLHINKKYIKV